jgi:beta-glucanase (GH16 family)
VILLWPADERWPDEGEIDLAEIFNGTRQSAGEFVHYGHDNHQAVGPRLRADFTSWHTIAMDWVPDHITFWLDGSLHWTVQHNSNPAKNVVPSTPFRLALQNDQGCSGRCHRTSSTPKNVIMDVDWVKIYRPLK